MRVVITGRSGIAREIERIVDSAEIPTTRVALTDDYRRLRRAFREQPTHVIHTAWDFRHDADYTELSELNLNRTREVYSEAQRQGCDHFLFVMPDSGGAPTTPRHLPASQQALRDAEIMLRGLSNRRPGGPQLTVLRHPATYGHTFQPLEAQPWLALPPLLAQRFELIPGLSGGPGLQWAHAWDVARAALHLSTASSVDRGGSYAICDNSALTLGEFFDVVVRSYGFNVGVKLPYSKTAAVLLSWIRSAPGAFFRDWLIRAVATNWSPPVPERARPARVDLRQGLQRMDFDRLRGESACDFTSLSKTGFKLNFPDIGEALPSVVRRYQNAGELPDRAAVEDGRAVEVLGASLKETMSGHFVDRDGEEQPVSFTVRLFNRRLRIRPVPQFFQLDGRLHAGGLAEDVACIGTVTMDLLGAGTMAYDVGFIGDDGASYRLRGVKNVRLRALSSTMTTMKTWIQNDRADVVGEGVMRFELRRDLLRFMSSFRLHRSGVRPEPTDLSSSQTPVAGSDLG